MPTHKHVGISIFSWANFSDHLKKNVFLLADEIAEEEILSCRQTRFDKLQNFLEKKRKIFSDKIVGKMYIDSA